MNALPETFINLLQVHVSLKRIGKYLQLTEVTPIPPLSSAPISNTIAIQSANITWPRDRSTDSSAASTPRHKFMLVDLALKFPEGELTLVCGKLGSGKTLLLLGMSRKRYLECCSMCSSVTRGGGHPHRPGRLPAFTTGCACLLRRPEGHKRRLDSAWCLCLRATGGNL